MKCAFTEATSSDCSWHEIIGWRRVVDYNKINKNKPTIIKAEINCLSNILYISL